MNVDLPAPGAPEMPTRMELPARGSTSASNASASARWSARVDSTSVIARANARRSPSITCFESSLMLVRSVSGVAQETDDLGCGLRDVGAGSEDRGDARFPQLVVVLHGDHAAGDNEDVVATLLAQLRDELGDQRLVARSLTRHTDEVDVVLDGVARGLFGSLEQ